MKGDADMKLELSKAKRVQLLVVVALLVVSVVYAGLSDDTIAQTAAGASRPLPVYSVETGDKTIAISFDAAWGEEKTDEILQILDERDISTTFFLVGFWVDAFPERVKQIAQAGHEIGNHSDTHPHMSELSEDQIVQELAAVSQKVEKLTGKPTTLFRPPYGDYDDDVVTVAREQGYEVVQWSCDSLDWKNKGRDEMILQVINNVKDGDIILFHNNSDYITEALPIILDRLLADGYNIVPVSEILIDGDYYIDHTGRQFASENTTPVPSASPKT